MYTNINEGGIDVVRTWLVVLPERYSINFICKKPLESLNKWSLEAVVVAYVKYYNNSKIVKPLVVDMISANATLCLFYIHISRIVDF